MHQQYRGIMDRQEWIARCSARLREQWPRLALEQLQEVAGELHDDTRRRLEEPERAAVLWLKQGLPKVH
jgi:hypothetical protein